MRLKFASPRPESFAIYKKFRNEPWKEDEDPDGGWIPWQFYSASCRDTYGESSTFVRSSVIARGSKWSSLHFTTRFLTSDVPESTSIIQPTGDSEETSYRKLGEDRALCTSEFSDISPLTGGNVK